MPVFTESAHAGRLTQTGAIRVPSACHPRDDVPATRLSWFAPNWRDVMRFRDNGTLQR